MNYRSAVLLLLLWGVIYSSVCFAGISQKKKVIFQWATTDISRWDACRASFLKNPTDAYFCRRRLLVKLENKTHVQYVYQGYAQEMIAILRRLDLFDRYLSNSSDFSSKNKKIHIDLFLWLAHGHPRYRQLSKGYTPQKRCPKRKDHASSWWRRIGYRCRPRNRMANFYDSVYQRLGNELSRRRGKLTQEVRIISCNTARGALGRYYLHHISSFMPGILIVGANSRVSVTRSRLGELLIAEPVLRKKNRYRSLECLTKKGRPECLSKQTFGAAYYQADFPRVSEFKTKIITSGPHQGLVLVMPK